MPILSVPNCGSAGVIKDLSKHDLPPNAWTDARNIRFLDGMTSQFLGHDPVYGTPTVSPLHVLLATSGATRYLVYAGAGKVYCASVSAGVATHTNITRAAGGDYTGSANAWTSCSLSGIPILNPGNTVDPPQQWSLAPASPLTALSNWPANTYCKSIRAYKNFLVALNITKTTTNYPFMVKWSHPADPGAVPASWDPTDTTKDAGEFDLAEGGDAIVDGLQLRDSFLIYKERSVWRMDFVGGPYVFRFTKVIANAGALNRNCIVEVNGIHVVLTNSDVIVHDGNQPQSVLDKATRRHLFTDMDATYKSLAFVVANPFFNEVLICYPAVGSTVCDRAMVWNYVDKTVSFRDLPNVYHATTGAVDSSTNDAWSADSLPWSADLGRWGSGGLVPEFARVIMASSAPALYMLDSSAAFNGVIPDAYVERVGLNLGDQTKIKTIKRVRPRITGNVGETVKVYIGAQDDPYEDPTYTETTYTIGSTVACDCFVSGRYLAIKFGTGSAYNWRMDSYDIEFDQVGDW